jgi:hypothetical protein
LLWVYAALKETLKTSVSFSWRLFLRLCHIVDCRFCGDASLNEEPSPSTKIGESRDDGESGNLFFYENSDRNVNGKNGVYL